MSVNRACRMVFMSHASFYADVEDPLVRDKEIIEGLQAMLARNHRWGFWKCFDRFQLMGKPWNHKRVYRVYKSLGLHLRRRTKKRLPVRERQSMKVIPQANQTWSMDFMSDTLYSGRRFRTLNVMDEGVREALGIEIDTSLPAERVVRVLDQITSWRGYPKAIRCDNGPEFIAQVLMDWCREHDIELRYIQPGKPNQNAFIERFNRTYREDILSAYLFEDLDQVQELTHEWLYQYNEERPHDGLGGLPPTVYRNLLESKNSTLVLSA